MQASDARTEPPASGVIAVAEDGLFAGVIGALVVALFFLVVDTLQGKPLFTPSLLGTVLFTDTPASQVTEVSIPMMFAYTGVHMILFLIGGLAAAIMVQQFESHPAVGMVLVILFICYEVGFMALAWALMPSVIGVLSAWLVALANVLSAGAMAVYLLWYSHPGALRSLDRVWDDA